jgi:hypothetical protein
VKNESLHYCSDKMVVRKEVARYLPSSTSRKGIINYRPKLQGNRSNERLFTLRLETVNKSWKNDTHGK